MTTETGESILQAGDVRIVGAVVVNRNNQGIDVKNLLLELKIYENVFSPFITGTMTVADATSLSTALPFIGEELLVLEVETPAVVTQPENSDITRRMRRFLTFHIYKMSAQVNIALKSKFYTLHFITTEGFVDMNKSLSQTFRGRISDVARGLIKNDAGLESPKEPVVEDTTNTVTFTSNFWSPAKCLYYVAERAVNAVNNPSFLFFENNEGFVFASLETLYATPPIQQFFRDQKVRGALPNIDEEYQRVLDMSSSNSVFDYIETKELGGYGSTIYEYSVDRKAITKTTLKRTNNPFFPEVTDNALESAANPSSNVKHSGVHRSLFNGYSNLDSVHEIKRALILKNLQNITTNIQVLGRMDYTVGRMVELTVYKDETIDEETDDEKLEDPILSGNYLVTALCHVITREKHVTNMELSKPYVRPEEEEPSQ